MFGYLQPRIKVRSYLVVKPIIKSFSNLEIYVLKNILCSASIRKDAHKFTLIRKKSIRFFEDRIDFFLISANLYIVKHIYMFAFKKKLKTMTRKILIIAGSAALIYLSVNIAAKPLVLKANLIFY